MFKVCQQLSYGFDILVSSWRWGDTIFSNYHIHVTVLIFGSKLVFFSVFLCIHPFFENLKNLFTMQNWKSLVSNLPPFLFCFLNWIHQFFIFKQIKKQKKEKEKKEKTKRKKREEKEKQKRKESRRRFLLSTWRAKGAKIVFFISFFIEFSRFVFLNMLTTKERKRKIKRTKKKKQKERK